MITIILELLFVAIVFLFSRIYFLGILLVDVIKLKMKKLLYQPFFPVNNNELPDSADLEGWRDFRIQYMKKIDSDKLLALNKEIDSVLKSRGVVAIGESSEEENVGILRRQLENAIGVAPKNKTTHPSFNIKGLTNDLDFANEEKDGLLLAISKASKIYRSLEAEELDRDERDNVEGKNEERKYETTDAFS